jgi:hypothetical protein
MSHSLRTPLRILFPAVKLRHEFLRSASDVSAPIMLTVSVSEFGPEAQGTLLTGRVVRALENRTGPSTLSVGAGLIRRTPGIAVSNAFLAFPASDCNGWARLWVWHRDTNGTEEDLRALLVTCREKICRWVNAPCASEPGKDAFHRVPDFAQNEWDAGERVLTILGDSFRGRAALLWPQVPRRTQFYCPGDAAPPLVLSGPNIVFIMPMPMRIICNWLVWNLPSVANCSGERMVRARS